MLASRCERGALIGATSVFMTLLAHSLGAGSLAGAFPSVWTLIVLFIVGAALGALVLEVQRGLFPLIAFMLGVQALFHVILVVTDAHHAGHGFLPSVNMCAAHLIAACAISYIVIRADGIAMSWYALWRSLSQRIVLPMVPVAQGKSFVFVLITTVHTSWTGGKAFARRGPPVLPSHA